MDNRNGNNMRYNGMNMYSRNGNMQRQYVQQNTGNGNSGTPRSPKNGNQQTNRSNAALPAGTNQGSNSIRDMLGGIVLDEEKMMILLLIAILAKNGADLPLLAALGYLLF